MSYIKNKLAQFRAILRQENKRKYLTVFSLILLAVFLCELFIFNYKWVSSAFDRPVRAADIESSEGTVSFSDINEEIKYIRIDPGAGQLANISISAADEANSDGVGAPQYTVLGDVDRSQYIRLHFSGRIKALTVKSDLDTLDAGDITLNTSVPLMFSWLRLILTALILMTLYVLRPGSAVYKYKTDLKKGTQRLIAAALIAVQALTLLYMIHWNTDAIGWHKSWAHHRQYYALIDSIKQGRLDIGEADSRLAEMDNPYDKSERDRLGVSYNWDHAYYNGKYYVYFGAVPAVLLYLPYNLITGQDLPNYIAVYILCILTMSGIMLLLWEIIKKWFKNTPFAVYLVLSVVFGAVSGIGYAVYKPDFYLVPPMTALALGVFGLAFWLSAEKRTGAEAVLSCPRLALGSLCIALTAGCRPQMTLAAFLGVVLFRDAAFKKRLLFSKKSIRATAAVCVPFIIVAAALMWYNAARFGSPFDFGANYNLTTNDMTHRGWVWGRTGLGLFSYLFQPIRFVGVFPFLKDFDADTVYQGLTLTEMMVGGIFCLFPVLTPALYGSLSRSAFDNRLAHRIVCISVIMAAVIAVTDAQMAGLLTRYFTDFTWLVMLASSISVFALFNRQSGESKGLRALIIALSFISLAIVFLRVFAHSEDSIRSANPLLYYNIERLIAFWM